MPDLRASSSASCASTSPGSAPTPPGRRGTRPASAAGSAPSGCARTRRRPRPTRAAATTTRSASAPSRACRQGWATPRLRPGAPAAAQARPLRRDRPDHPRVRRRPRASARRDATRTLSALVVKPGGELRRPAVRPRRPRPAPAAAEPDARPPPATARPAPSPTCARCRRSASDIARNGNYLRSPRPSGTPATARWWSTASAATARTSWTPTSTSSTATATRPATSRSAHMHWDAAARTSTGTSRTSRATRCSTPTRPRRCAPSKEAFCLANTDAVDLTVPNAAWNVENTDLVHRCGDHVVAVDPRGARLRLGRHLRPVPRRAVASTCAGCPTAPTTWR